MDVEKQIEWLKPDRIMKLREYDGEYDVHSRLLVIGIGENGTDCLLQCKDAGDNRFGRDNNVIQYLGIDLPENLNKELRGSVLSAEEKLEIIPEEAIYPYLNNTVPLPDYVQSWFDEGLRNYTTAAPKYGLQKRQCGRLALIHCIDALLERLNKIKARFAGNERPLEIAVCGNLGDAFYGGMMIDLGFILGEVFKSESYAVKINAYTFVGDTAKLFVTDSRNLAHYYANIVVAKSELDKFQCHKRTFSQKYSDSFEITTDHQPYHSCFIAKAESSYEQTLEAAAEKIVSAVEIQRTKDDDADKIMTYNMLGKGDDHTFRYLTYSVKTKRLPLGKLASYLSLRIFGSMANNMRGMSMGEGELSILVSKAVPNAGFLASKAGIVSNLEFNESLNPLFSLKSLKKGGEASKNYVLDKMKEFELLTRQGADIFLPQAYKNITEVCDEARSSADKGPFYAAGIVKKCISELESAIKRITAEKDDVDAQMPMEEKLVVAAYRTVKHTPSFMASGAVEKYISRLKEFADYEQKHCTYGTLVWFYEQMLEKLKGYYEDNLKKTVELFDSIAEQNDEFMKLFAPREGIVSDSVDVSTPDIMANLDKLADGIPETTKKYIQKRTQLLSDSDDETTFAKELLSIVSKCGFLEGFSNFFSSGIEKTSEECAEAVVEEENPAPLVRIIGSAGRSSALRKKYSGMNFIFNSASISGIAVAVRIDGGIQLSDFKDCEQWENMRYAYVNDSLKKHGIHIFKGRR